MTEGNKKQKKKKSEEEDNVSWGRGDENLQIEVHGAAPSENDD